MDFNVAGSGGRLFESIKTKLGFGDETSGYTDDYYDSSYEDGAYSRSSRRGLSGSSNGFDDDRGYGAYADDGYGDESFDEYDADYSQNDAPGSNYSPFAPVTLRSTRSSASASYARYGTDASLGAVPPKLVSIEDVRSSSRVAASSNRDSLSAREASSPRNHGSSAASGNVYGSGEARAFERSTISHERSESLDSLFRSTSSRQDESALPSARNTGGMAEQEGSSTFHSVGNYTVYSPRRKVTVLKPQTYEEVETITQSLKAGDAVVLALSDTPRDLVPRVLDFSFGVSSALDCRVDCLANGVYAILRGNSLSPSEMYGLRRDKVIP